MDGSFPVLLVDIIGFSKRNSTWQVMLLEELHAAMSGAASAHLPAGDSWGRLTKQGTGDGWYVFLEQGFDASSSLDLVLNLSSEIDARNDRKPDLKLRVRSVLVYGPVTEVAGQFHAEINTIGARLLDGELLRSAAKEWDLSCVLAVSDVFWNQLDQESQSLRWSRIEETDKHGGVHPGYLFVPEGCKPPVDFHRDILQKIETAKGQRSRLVEDGRDTTDVDNKLTHLKRLLRSGAEPEKDDVLGGRFKLIEKIERGGFAQVWKAYDRERQVDVAVKVLHGQYGNDATLRNRFFRGAENMAKLRHQGIVEVLEKKQEDDGLYFFVMEYLPGGDLRKAVLSEKLSLTQKLDILLEVGEALSFAHESGLVHRDVKPANILLDDKLRAKLTDFDLVRVVDSTAGTRRTQGMGTFGYAAPEALEHAKNADERADVYSLAMTAIFMFGGNPLNAKEMLRKPEDAVRRLDLPEACRDVLIRGIEWEAKDRFATVGEFCEALSASFTSRVSEKKTRLQWLIGTIFMILGIGGIWLFQWLQPLPEEPVPERVLITREAFEEDVVGLKFLPIPKHKFVMGSPEGEPGRFNNETQREVTLTYDFWMSQTEVTQAQWVALMGENPSHFKNCDDCPVENVSWSDAARYANRLTEEVNRRTGSNLEICYVDSDEGEELRFQGLECTGYRLPTEAEWEYAARGGTSEATYAGAIEILGTNHAPVLDSIAWYGGNSGVGFEREPFNDSSDWSEKQYDHSKTGTRRVKQKTANAYGLYDMLGNVWEWTNDWYGEYPAGPALDPIGPDQGSDRVGRGGSWRAHARVVRAACRFAGHPSARYYWLGFRLTRGQSLLQQEAASE